MKKRLILFLIYLFFPFYSFCQGFYPGIFGGIIGSQVDGDMMSGYNKPGATFGLVMTYNLTKIYFIQTELEFIQKGSREVAHPDQGIIHSYEIKLDYAEVPFLFNYVINKKYIPEAGIAFAYLIKSGEIIDDYNYTPVLAFNKFEYSFIIGFNYKLTDKFRANIRYSYSIFPVRKLMGDKSTHFVRSQYNNLLGFSLYYYFLNNSESIK
jgi:hypothetical protein